MTLAPDLGTILIWQCGWDVNGSLSKLGQLLTRGPRSPWRYGHVTLALNHGSHIEIGLGGQPTQDELTEEDWNSSGCCCGRCAPLMYHPTLTDEQKVALYTAAVDSIYLFDVPRYSRLAGVASGLKLPYRGNGFSCATYVARLFEIAGAPLFPRHYSTITPSDIAALAISANERKH